MVMDSYTPDGKNSDTHTMPHHCDDMLSYGVLQPQRAPNFKNDA